MISPREEQLREGLREMFIGIQNSTDVLKEKISERWKKNILKMNKKEIERVSKTIASRVEKSVRKIENDGIKPSPKIIKKKLSEELERIGQ